MKKLLIIAILLTGCSVNSGEITRATELCKDNDGVDIITHLVGDIQVSCKNTARFIL